MSVVLLGAVMLAACAAPQDPNPAGVVVTDSDGWRGAALDEPYELPDVVFTDTAGEPFDLRADRPTPVSVIFFGYTHCPDVCNTVMAEVASALRRADASVRDQVQVLFISTDPERDTPEAVRKYLDAFDPAFEGLVADAATVQATADALKVALDGTTLVPGGYEVIHGAQLLGVNAQGQVGIVWPEGTPVGDLRADLERMVDHAATGADSAAGREPR